MITQKELKEILDYNPETGVFIWLKHNKNQKSIGDAAGHLMAEGRTSIRINYISYLLHRLAWLYVYGKWPNEIDHINHNQSDNRISNLREVTHRENMLNQSMCKNNTSGVTGVYWHKKNNKWFASIMVKGVAIHLGISFDKFEMMCARKSAEIKYGFHVNHGK